MVAAIGSKDLGGRRRFAHLTRSAGAKARALGISRRLFRPSTRFARAAWVSRRDDSRRVPPVGYPRPSTRISRADLLEWAWPVLRRRSKRPPRRSSTANSDRACDRVWGTFRSRHAERIAVGSDRRRAIEDCVIASRSTSRPWTSLRDLSLLRRVVRHAGPQGPDRCPVSHPASFRLEVLETATKRREAAAGCSVVCARRFAPLPRARVVQMATRSVGNSLTDDEKGLGSSFRDGKCL